MAASMKRRARALQRLDSRRPMSDAAAMLFDLIAVAARASRLVLLPVVHIVVNYGLVASLRQGIDE